MNETQSTDTLARAGIEVSTWKEVKQLLTPIIVAVGLFGNFLAFLVFIFSRLNKMSISVYLAGLAVADSGFLLTVGAVWLNDIIGAPMFDTDGKCIVLVYFTFVFSFLSVWLVVAFTSEIYFSIFCPLLRDRVCRRNVALVATTCLLLIGGCAYCPTFWTVKSVSYAGTKSCHFLSNSSLMKGISITDTVITLALPFTVLIVMNVYIFLEMLKFYGSRSSRRKAMTFSGPESTSARTLTTPVSSGVEFTDEGTTDTNPTMSSMTADVGDDRRASLGSRAQEETSKMLLVVAIVFLILNLPSHLIRLQHWIRAQHEEGYKPTQTEARCLDVFNTLHWVNYAINFALYSACGKTFRQAVLRGITAFLENVVLCCFHVTRKALRRSQYPMYSVPGGDKAVCHLSAMQLSHLQPLDDEFVLNSPPCLLIPSNSSAEQR